MTTAGLDSQPSAATYDLEDLVTLAWQGGIRIPHFQRDFRWGATDVARLFDSILKGYPIGSLLLWVRRSPAARTTLGALEIEAPASDSVLWVVDGQQRITSLANALHPDGHGHPPFNIAYDLAKTDFVTFRGVADPMVVPLPVLFDLDRLINWFAQGGQAAQEGFPEARRAAKLLRQFKVPAYLVRQSDEKTLTDIFDRMNNYGKRLSRVEVFSALFAGPESRGGESLTIGGIADHVATRTGFGQLDDDTVLAAVLARRGSNPSREIRTEFDSARRRISDFPDEDRDTAHHQAETALVRAVEFLQREAGVPHLSLLAYRALLVVLTRFFAHFPDPAERNLQLLRRMYWRVTMSGYSVFRGTSTQLSRTLSARIHPDDEHGSVRGLLEALSDSTPPPPSLVRFRTNEATTKMILCSWWALHPCSPVTGDPYDSQELAVVLADQKTAGLAVRRIFLRGVSPERSVLPANHFFAPSETDPVDDFPTLLSRRPANIDEQRWDRVLASYCLTRDSAALLDDAEAFLTVRQQAITEQFRRFVNRMAEWDYEDTPALDSLDLDDLEDRDPENEADGAG
jgi:hypothetical protein